METLDKRRSQAFSGQIAGIQPVYEFDRVQGFDWATAPPWQPDSREIRYNRKSYRVTIQALFSVSPALKCHGRKGTMSAPLMWLFIAFVSGNPSMRVLAADIRRVPCLRN